jgi:hypothetical protein
MDHSMQQQEIERLEHAFWQSMVDGKPNVATGMLSEPALMVSGHGAMQFDHAGYETMARSDRHRLVGFDLSDMRVVFPRTDVAIATYRAAQSVERDGRTMQEVAVDSSTWVRFHEGWKCVAHTESLQPRPD